MKIPSSGILTAFAMFVDLNQFTPMVSEAESTGISIAQFVRDCLDGAIAAIESEDGEVVGFIGDAIFAVLPDSDATFKACVGVARMLDRLCEYISTNQAEDENLWPFAPGGPSFKISTEYGEIDVTTISSRFLGTQRLLIGSPINYAARIASAGSGNRCLVGPRAAEEGLSSYPLEGPFEVSGKPGERTYQYFKMDLSDVWIEGDRQTGKDTFWG